MINWRIYLVCKIWNTGVVCHRLNKIKKGDGLWICFEEERKEIKEGGGLLDFVLKKERKEIKERDGFWILF